MKEILFYIFSIGLLLSSLCALLSFFLSPFFYFFHGSLASVYAGFISLGVFGVFAFPFAVVISKINKEEGGEQIEKKQ